MNQREQAIAALERVRSETGDMLVKGMELNQLILQQRILVPKLDMHDLEILNRTANLMLIDMRARLPKPARAAA